MKHLLLPIIQNMMDINVELHQWLITFLDRNSIQQLAEKMIKRFKKNKKYALPLKTTFGVLI